MQDNLQDTLTSIKSFGLIVQLVLGSPIQGMLWSVCRDHPEPLELDVKDILDHCLFMAYRKSRNVW